MKTVPIQLDSRSYNILIDTGLLPCLGDSCKAVGLSGTAALITNPVVDPLYGDIALAALARAGYKTARIIVPDGEEHKNSQSLGLIYDQLIQAQVDRHSFIVALGGGVVGDLAGFAAATFLRGIPFVQVPTTLLAQVDSSVGGKTGIDHPAGKNLIGAFYQPRLVVADLDTLQTLSERHYLAGLAEVIKYGVVLDAGLFELLEASIPQLQSLNTELLSEVVALCCRIKARVVEQDEKESGLRAVLNYGHTLGHAFELLSGYSGLVHGEAVAIGMTLAAEISRHKGDCTAEDVSRIVQLLGQLGLPTVPPDVSRDKLAAALVNDKKNYSGNLQYVCNRGIGDYSFYQITPTSLAELCCTRR